MRNGIDKLLGVVNAELAKAEKNYKAAKISAQEVAASASASPSQSGDRFHSQGAADLVKQRLNALRALETEIKSGSVLYIEKDGQEFFLVKNVALVPGINLVSLYSPVGKKLKKYVE